MDNLVVDPADDPALLEIDDRMDHTIVLMMMLLHLHRLARIIRMYSTLLSSLPTLPVDVREGLPGDTYGHSSGYAGSHSNPRSVAKVQGQLNRMEQAPMHRLRISFAPAPPRDVPADDSETDDDPDD
ncbi:hypothetical protein Syun_016689 [Stephania yunnanensis]|uniref:Uncharacterized protein n=1 Tax=Stephania yunnanensis TaxID=152371 RepID=A0AAP0J7W9_9MAGN